MKVIRRIPFLCAQIPGKGKATRVSRETELAAEVAQLKKCMGDLSKQIAEKDGRRQADEVSEAERAVKEEAMKRPELMSLDILHQKLVRLEDAARRANHSQIKKFGMVLQRFSFYKVENPAQVGQLILSLLSTPEETAILEKERKFLKSTSSAQPNPQAWGGQNPMTTGQGASPFPAQGPSQPWGPTSGAWGPMPQGGPPANPDGRYAHQPQGQQPRFRSGGKRGGFSGKPPQNRDGSCFKCYKFGHFMRDCPNWGSPTGDRGRDHK